MKKLSNVERIALGSIREELQPSRLDQGAQGRGRGAGGVTRGSSSSSLFKKINHLLL